MPVVAYAIPFFALSLLLEWRLTMKRGVLGYELRDTAASLTMGIVNLGILTATKGLSLLLFYALYELRIFTVPMTVAGVAALIVCEDLCYYWFHRSHHEVRMFWAGHVSHHSSTRYNLSTALRQSWTSPITGMLFWAPLPLFGFHPLAIMTAQSVSLLYQYWIHTELIDKLGPLEWVFNTPSHHRVHHATNGRYLDRNHGGILIIWDRLFGTFEPERERPIYGLTTNIDTHNPVKIAFHEWASMLRDVAGARTWRGRLGYLFAPPGYREDGQGKTSAVLRREAAQES